jgi:predicted GNAT family N-acyltransferase
MDHNFCYKHFSELSTTELYKILKLRQDVFIVEQNCIYADLDDVDLNCFHLMMIKNSELIGYSRIIAPGIKYTSSSIGRVIIKPGFRGNKLAYSLMKESINCCNIDWKNFGMGNILKQDFWEVWNGKKYREVRRMLRDRKAPLMCKGCNRI